MPAGPAPAACRDAGVGCIGFEFVSHVVITSSLASPPDAWHEDALFALHPDRCAAAASAKSAHATWPADACATAAASRATAASVAGPAGAVARRKPGCGRTAGRLRSVGTGVVVGYAQGVAVLVATAVPGRVVAGCRLARAFCPHCIGRLALACRLSQRLQRR